jgi:hypothetical protein
LVVTGCNFELGVFLDPLGNGPARVEDVCINGNVFYGGGNIVGRGKVHRIQVHNNIFLGTPTQLKHDAVLWFGQNGVGDRPSDISIRGNMISNQYLGGLGTLGAVVLDTTSARFGGNAIRGGGYNFALYLMNAGTTLGQDNDFDAGTVGTVNGYLTSVPARAANNAGGYKVKTTGNGVSGFDVSTDNWMTWSAANASGNDYQVLRHKQLLDAQPLYVMVPLGLSSGCTFASGTAAPDGSTPGANVEGSQYLRKGGGAGAHLYISQGAGTWLAVAGA